jgi:pimeloyl-ACP methyl ester carboxylesterase
LSEHLILLERNSDDAVVLFTSRGNGRDFGFYHIGHRIESTALLVKDPTNNWYNVGIEGVGAHVDEIAQTLRAKIGSRRVITVGSSMGAYAAILFGCLLGAERCIAFAPQTRLAGKLPLSPPRDVPLQAPDTRSYLLQSPSTKVAIFIGGFDLADAYHAYRIADLPNVSVSVLPSSGHSIAEALAGTRQLDEIVYAGIAGDIGTPVGFEPGIADRGLRDAIVGAVEARYFGGDALPHLQHLAKAVPNWVAVRQFEGQVLMNAGRYAEAEAALRTVVDLQPGWFIPYRHLGEAIMRQGRLVEAETFLRRAVEMRPDWGWAHCYLAECLFRLGRQAEGEPHFVIAAQIESEVPIVRERLLTELSRLRT